MNGHGATVAASDLQVNEDKTNMDLVVKEVVDLAKIGEVLEDVDSESQKLVLDMRSLPEEDMQVVFQSLLRIQSLSPSMQRWQYPCF